MRALIIFTTLLAFSLSAAEAAAERYPYQSCFEIASEMHGVPVDLLLAVAATIYAMFCPGPVKEATETGWTRQLGQTLFEYRSAAYSRISLRYLCATLYAVGGLYTLGYLFSRAWVAARYLLSGSG